MAGDQFPVTRWSVIDAVKSEDSAEQGRGDYAEDADSHRRILRILQGYRRKFVRRYAARSERQVKQPISCGGGPGELLPPFYCARARIAASRAQWPTRDLPRCKGASISTSKLFARMGKACALPCGLPRSRRRARRASSTWTTTRSPTRKSASTTTAASAALPP